jgi:hypothetical protein
MANFTAMRMLEVKKREWWVWKDAKLLMSGHETSRETAQIEGNSALFYLLRTPN